MKKPEFLSSGQDAYLDPKRLRRQVSPLGSRAFRATLSPLGQMAGSAGLAGAALAFPSITPLCAALGFALYAGGAIYARANRAKINEMPLRLPLDAKGELDFSNPLPGRKGYRKAEGAFFVGNSFDDRMREVWASFTDMLTHAMVLGGTGAGKTETLVSMAFNALSVGGGVGYVDAKASTQLYGQFWVMARMVGRDDDMRVLNFALGQERLGKTRFWRSNTMQPFAIGKAEALKEIPLSLMAGGGDGANSIFSSNAKALMTALMMALVEMRDKGEIYLYPGDIVKYMNPMEMVELAKRQDFTPTTTDAIQNFLKSLGWRPDVADSSKWGDFDRQYSYAQNYFLDTFSTMNNVYRHIFAAPIGDVNLTDVILQRRVFVTLIPSLEKSKKELENIGRITLSSLRLATAVGLGGGEIMGRWKQLIDLGIAKAEVPFFLEVDELAAIMIEGFAEIFTQARGLGVSATVGSQDWAGMQGASEMTRKEAKQIASNTKLKFFMTGDDPEETRKLFEALAGEADEMRTQGYSVNRGLNYYDNLSAQAQRVKRVDQRDISQQIEGEWHLFFKDKIIRGQSFFAGALPPTREMPLFVHHFLQVYRPDAVVLSAKYGNLARTLSRWAKAAQGEGVLEPEDGHPVPGPPEALVSVLANAPAEYKHKRRELAMAAVQAWLTDDPFTPKGTPSGATGTDGEAHQGPDRWAGHETETAPVADQHQHQRASADTGDDETAALDVEDVEGAADVEDVTDAHLVDAGGAEFDPDGAPDGAEIDDDLAQSIGASLDAVTLQITDTPVDIDDPEIPAPGSSAAPQEGRTRAAARDAVKVALSDPRYPSPPKPPKSDVEAFKQNTRAWLDSLRQG